MEDKDDREMIVRIDERVKTIFNKISNLLLSSSSDSIPANNRTLSRSVTVQLILAIHIIPRSNKMIVTIKENIIPIHHFIVPLISFSHSS